MDKLIRLQSLADLGEALAAKFAELSARPRADAADILLHELTQATNAVARLRDALSRGERVA